MQNHLDINLERAKVLLNHRRYPDAERELLDALSKEPDHDEALALLARLKIDTDKPLEALDLLDKALHANPQEDYYLYLKAFAFFKTENNTEAIQTLQLAIAVFPFNAGYFALYAIILLTDRKFEEALEKANKGLSMDPMDLGCLNARSRALQKLGRTEEAIHTMQDTLAADPENDYSHTTIGLNFLEKGKHQKAAHHFREALRINPTNLGARSGIKEALKSKIAPYRWLLQYGVWLGNLGKNARIIMIVGVYLLFRLSIYFTNQLPAKWDWIPTTIMAAYIFAVLVSWLIEPLANFFLMFHKEGKYALTDSEKWNSKLVITSILLGLSMFTIYAFYSGGDEDLQTTLLVSALVFGSLSLPISRVQFPIHLPTSKFKDWVIFTVIGLGLLTLSIIGFSEPAGLVLATIYAACLALSSWILTFSKG